MTSGAWYGIFEVTTRGCDHLMLDPSSLDFDLRSRRNQSVPYHSISTSEALDKQGFIYASLYWKLTFLRAPNTSFARLVIQAF